MKIAILGLGGVGATVAASLKDAPHELIFIVRGKTKEAINENGGLKYTTPLEGSFLIKPALATDDETEIGVVDVLFITTKSYSLEQVCSRYEKIIGEHTVVIPLLNGFAARRTLAEQYLKDRGTILEGCIYCFSKIISPGVVENYDQLENLSVHFGLPDGKEIPVAKEVADLMTKGGLPAIYNQGILETIWKKYMLMCGNSCALIHFNCDVGTVQDDPKKLEFLVSIQHDLRGLALAAGVNVPEETIAENIAYLKRANKTATTSLYRDWRDKLEHSELEWLMGNAVRLAKELGITIEFVEQAYASALAGA
ncbi:MAG: 2-dehydropantoate 2-reductase [Bacillota bacterium]